MWRRGSRAASSPLVLRSFSSRYNFATRTYNETKQINATRNHSSIPSSRIEGDGWDTFFIKLSALAAFAGMVWYSSDPPSVHAKSKSSALTKEQVNFYRENGYLIIEDLLSAKECDTIVKEAEQMISTICAGTDANPNRVLSIIQPHHSSDVMRSFVVHPTIVPIISTLAGAHLRDWGHRGDSASESGESEGPIKALQSMYFLKPPGYVGQAWHQDELYIPTRDRSLTAVWIALEDVDNETGTLWVIPGSHRNGQLYPTKPHQNSAEYEYDDESYVATEDEGKRLMGRPIPVPLRQGSALFFNGYLLHRSGKNQTSNRTRKVLTNHYASAYSLVPWATDTKQMPAQTDYRNWILFGNDEKDDPYRNTKPITHESATHLRILNEDGTVKKIFQKK